MKIELEAVPMLVGFSVGMVFFLSQRLFGTRVQTPSKEEEEVVVEEDDETWLAARGLNAGDLPKGGPEDTQDAIKGKDAKSAKSLEVDGMGVQGLLLTEEPSPEPTPLQEEGKRRNSAPTQAAAPKPRRPALAMFGGLELVLLLGTLTGLKLLLPSPSSGSAGADESQVEGTIPALETHADMEIVQPTESSTVNGSMPLTLKLTRQNTPTQVIDGVMYHRSAYWGTLFFGTPAVPFSVVFDTGSGHLILPSTYCHSEVCRARRRYRAKSSTTAKSINHDGSQVQPYELRDQITVSFGTGEVSGVFMEDELCIPEFGSFEGPGDPNVRTAACMPMRMIAATAMSEDPFEEFSFDGVLGLGLLGLSQGAGFNFLSVAADALGETANRHARTFSLFLAHGDNQDDASEITLGGYNPERLYGAPSWNSVVQPELGQWMIEVKSLRVGDHQLEYCRSGCRAIMDTGTSMLAVPSNVISELFELLEHPSSNHKDCRGPGPQLHFDMEDITITLDPEDYAHFDTPELADVDGSMSQTSDLPSCKAMLMTMDLPEPVGPKLFILGEPVLRKYYTVYDAKSTPRVGLGLARHPVPSA